MTTDTDDKPTGTLVERAALRIPLLIALLAAAAVTLIFQRPLVGMVRAGEAQPWVLLAAPAAFALVVVIGAIDAWRTARRRGYFHGRTVVALVAAIAFVSLLFPETFAEYRARTGPPASSPARYAALLASKDAHVRATVMELLGYKPMPPEELAPLLRLGLNDRDPMVQQAAREAVGQRVGRSGLSTAEAEQALTTLHP